MKRKQSLLRSFKCSLDLCGTWEDIGYISDNATPHIEQQLTFQKVSFFGRSSTTVTPGHGVVDAASVGPGARAPPTGVDSEVVGASKADAACLTVGVAAFLGVDRALLRAERGVFLFDGGMVR